jgi:hypothetical protein
MIANDPEPARKVGADVGVAERRAAMTAKSM